MPEPTAPKTFEQAREQAAEYLGLLAPEYIRSEKGEIFEIPSQHTLDEDQQARLDQLQLDVETWDRHPDILNEDGTVRTRGDLKVPNRKGGKLVENYDTQRAKAIFGERYAAFKAAGGRPSDVSNFWWKQNKALADRAKKDPKSGGSSDDLDPVPDSD